MMAHEHDDNDKFTGSKSMKELQESEARLRATMESAITYAIITTDANGIITEWNPGAERIFGYDREEVTGKNASLIFTPEDRAAGAPEQEMETARREGKAADERWHLKKNGQRFYMSGTLSPIYQEGLTGFVKVGRDLTVEKTAQEALRLSEERHRTALEEFIGIAGHELKTPVTSMRAYAEMLLQILEKTPETKAIDVSRKLNEQINRLGELIQMLLDTTRISEGVLSLSTEQVDLDTLVKDIVENLRSLSPEYKFVVHTGVGQPIPGDPERIRQVINNLVTNAVNYSPKGSTITIDTAREDHFATVQVRDEGIGIDKADTTRIFERFVRIPKGNPLDYAGMGLGLYISAGIVHHHGGTISVESEINKGSLFTVRLPVY